MILFRTTLDVDTNDKETIKRITDKIFDCEHIFEVNKKPSNLKGYHFILKCFIECDVCRMCFDDQKRFNFDMARPTHLRNVLFNKVV